MALSRTPDLLTDCWVYHIDSGETVHTVRQEDLFPTLGYPLYLPGCRHFLRIYHQ